MRETSLKVQIALPEATEVAKLKRKSLVAYIYIGPPLDPLQEKYGSEPRIQLDDAFAPHGEHDIPEFVQKVVSTTAPEEVPLLTYSLKVDGETKMGIVTDVKQQLRKVNALKINYSTKKGVQK